MKRILIAAITITCAVACCPKQNNGAGYNTVTPAAAATPQNNTPDVSAFKKGHVTSVGKYGRETEVCTAYYGEFNGHTWYVFYDNLAAPAVVHDPLCACGGGRL